MKDMYEEMPEDKKKFDNFFIGFFVSILLVLIFLPLVAGGYRLEDDYFVNLERIYNSYNFINRMILALFPDMVLFFLLYKTERWKAAKGLIVAILLCVAVMTLR